MEQTFSPRTEMMPKATKEDHIIRLLDELIARDREDKGAVPQFFPFEGDIATLATARLDCDFPHDSWVVYFRNEANATLRIWPGGSPPALGAIELRNNVAVKLKSTSDQLYLTNTGTATCHYFAFALSLADLEFFSILGA